MARDRSFLKRQKERERQEKRAEKELRRAERRKKRKEDAPDDGVEDPDIADIVPGPQPQEEELIAPKQSPKGDVEENQA